MLRFKKSTQVSLILLAFGPLCLCGCVDAVQEDRSIEWSGDGRSAGFQHGQEGVFLTDDSDEGVENIFKPDADVLATSTPRWSPDGNRVIFTTARAFEVEVHQPREDEQPRSAVDPQS